MFYDPMYVWFIHVQSNLSPTNLREYKYKFANAETSAPHFQRDLFEFIVLIN